jgi:hypothetical protein
MLVATIVEHVEEPCFFLLRAFPALIGRKCKLA